MNATAISESMAETSKEIEKRAQSYIDLGYEPQALMKKIRNDAIGYYSRNNLTPAHGIDIAAMMLAAITLAKQSGAQ